MIGGNNQFFNKKNWKLYVIQNVQGININKIESDW